MMSKLNCSLIFLMAVTIASCRSNTKYSIAIKDFSKQLQPRLVQIVSKGIVMYPDSSLRYMTTDQDLYLLSNCEHPILRATAFRELLRRDSFGHSDIILKHLDDTALVFVDAGEFGIGNRTVSDDILQEATWKTQQEKDKIVEQVLVMHNYLRSAYLILRELDSQDKFYPYIKNMATRPRHLDYEGYELSFGDIEYALYGLAKFKKKEDVKIISDRMMEYAWRLSDLSFQLMKEFPDTAYIEVLQKYYRRQFYRFSGNRPYGFSGIVADRAAPEDFIKALAAQQTDKSAKLLDSMLILLPNITCLPDKETILQNLILEIWDNPCVAYAKLRKKIKAKAEVILKKRIYLPMDIDISAIDTVKRTFRW